MKAYEKCPLVGNVAGALITKICVTKNFEKEIIVVLSIPFLTHYLSVAHPHCINRMAETVRLLLVWTRENQREDKTMYFLENKKRSRRLYKVQREIV